MDNAFPAGFGLGLSLILAIGAQNAFVLRQGLRNEHLFAVCAACALSDMLLIALGVSGFGAILALAPWIDPALRLGGGAFLLWYGGRSFLSAFKGNGALVAAGAAPTPLVTTMVTCLTLTWLNPHVYLDTVVFLGTLSTRFPGAESLFGAGAAAASLVFFFTLGYGARLLAPVFAKPVAWRILDMVVGTTMWVIAFGLVIGR
jgi:L-lysine exporter family protein LysE/ArgO